MQYNAIVLEYLGDNVYLCLVKNTDCKLYISSDLLSYKNHLEKGDEISFDCYGLSIDNDLSVINKVSNLRQVL